MKKPGLGRLGPRQGEKGRLMGSTVDFCIVPRKSQINLADNLEYLPAGVVTAMPAYFIKGAKV